MTAYSYDRGHEIFFDGSNWRYSDTKEISDDSRTCAKCGHYPNADGSDHCLGHIDGATAACCGHGVEDGYVMYENGSIIRWPKDEQKA